MERTNATIPVELPACLLEINSDLGYLLDCGIDGDVLESIAVLQARTAALIERFDTAMRPEGRQAR